MDAPSATGSSVTVRRDAAAVAWWVLVGAASGAIAGALVGGVGGRLAMLLLRLTSPDDVIGMISDDGFEIGVFSFDTAQLVLAMAMLGGDQRRALRCASQALSRGSYGCRSGRSSPPRSAARASSTTTGSTSRFLEPAALAIALFVLLPGAAAAVVVLLVERWMRVEPWSDRRLSIGLCIGAIAGTFALGLRRTARGCSARPASGTARRPGRAGSARSPCRAALAIVTALAGWRLVEETVRIL